jgi:hypothetical protein
MEKQSHSKAKSKVIVDFEEGSNHVTRNSTLNQWFLAHAAKMQRIVTCWSPARFA